MTKNKINESILGVLQPYYNQLYYKPFP